MIRVEGEVSRAREFDFAELRALPGQIDDLSTLVPGKTGGAVRLRALLDAVAPTASAAYASLCSEDGAFEISVRLSAIADNAVVAYRLGDAPLPEKQGGPARFYVVDAAACGEGEVDACANVKRLGTIRLTRERAPDVGHLHR